MTATERMPVVGAWNVVDTADERWAGDDEAWYKAAADYAVAKLGAGNGRVCLVIGSPIPEAKRLKQAGWEICYADVRDVTDVLIRSGLSCTNVMLDATDMGPSLSGKVDAISSTCVLCHAGLGRYGDPVKPNGDVLMLREIARVLKPGGRAAIMAGPTLPDEALPKSAIFGNVHRIYRVQDVLDMAKETGLELLDATVAVDDAWDAQRLLSTNADGEMTIRYCYLCVLLRKPV